MLFRSSVTSGVAVLTVISPPTITTHPQSQTLAQSNSVSFSVSATNTCGGGLVYQWRFNAANISSATDTAYSRTNLQCADAGIFDVVVANAAGSVTSSVANLVIVSPPSISTQPTNQTVVAGTSATLNVGATNDCGGGFVYQWLSNGTNISGATNASLTIANVQVANAGSYSVIAANLAGSATSAVAVLTVVLPPIVTPANLNLGIILTGLTSQASFTVSNAGSAALTVTATLDTPFAILDPGSNAVSTLAFDIPASGATNVAVRFTSPVAGIFSNAVVFTSATGDSTNAVTAQAFAPPVILSANGIGAEFTFSFATIAGLNYTVQFKDLIDDPVWQTFATVTGDGSVKILTNAMVTPSQRFFQLRIP